MFASVHTTRYIMSSYRTRSSSVRRLQIRARDSALRRLVLTDGRTTSNLSSRLFQAMSVRCRKVLDLGRENGRQQDQLETGYVRQGEYGLDPESVSGSGLLPKCNGDFLVQGYISDKICIKIRSLSPEIKAKL